MAENCNIILFRTLLANKTFHVVCYSPRAESLPDQVATPEMNELAGSVLQRVHLRIRFHQDTDEATLVLWIQKWFTVRDERDRA